MGPLSRITTGAAGAAPKTIIKVERPKMLRMPCQYSRAFSASILLLLAFVSLASAAATYAINFTTDAAGANIASSVTQCGTAIYANTNVTCSAASKCTWSILGIAYNTSARFSDKSCPSAFEFVGQIDKDKTTPSIKIAGCAGVGKSVTVAVTNGSATASATLMVIPADPTNMQVCGKGDRCSTNPTSAIEGANITYIAFLDTNMGALGGDCSSYAYLSQEDKGVSDTINDFLNRMRGLPRYQESPPVEVHINQTVRFRNWTKIYANIASGALTESNIADALKPTNTAYTYDVNLTTKQCQDAQSSGDYCTLQCTNPARLDKTQTWPNINGAVPFSLTAYRDAVWVESNFTVGSTQKQTITDPATGRTYEANVFTLYPSGGDQGKSFKVNVQFFRPVKGYGLANNASMPFESEVRNFYLNVTAMDASGLPTNMSGIGGCTTGGNSLIFPNILSINVSSGYVKNFVVNLSSSGMGCPTTPTLSDPATEQQWYVYNCTSYKGSFIPKKLEMGISKPGLYKVTVSSIEGAQLLDCAKFPLPGIPIWVEAKGAVKIVVQGVPRNVSVEAPPEWFEWVPFDVNLSLRDGAGKVVTGNAYNVSLSIASGSVGNYAVKTPAGDSCVSPATCNCTTGLLSGKCTIRLRAEAPLNSDNPELKFTGVYHGKSTIRPGKDCPIGGAGYCPADGTATTKIWESQCANFTVSPPPGPVEIADKAIAQNLSYLVNEANAKNYLMGPLLVGMDPSTQTMGGNASLCYDQPPQRVELCVNATSGMFVTPPGAGLMCIKEYIYTPEVDGAISDHLNFGDMNLSRKKLLETFYYPRVVWGWGFIGPNSTPQSTCGFLAPPGQGTHGGKGYIIKFPAQPEFPGEGDYFNITATSVRNISLPSYNITWDKAGAALGYSSGGLSGCTCDAGNPQCCASPHMITGMDALLVVDDSADAVANGGALRMFGMDGTYREKYPFYSDDYGLITPQSIISDKRGNIFVADTGHRRIVIFKLANVSYAKGLPSIQKIQLVPDKLELTPPSITGATEYDPMGVSLDTFNRLFIAGLTNPGQEENYLVIQVYGPDLKTAVANYSELRPYATHADISVDPQGVFIYVADDEKKIRQFAYTETPQSCLTASLPGSDQQICETSGSRGKTSSGNQGYHLYIPCRHLGSGCWDSNCGLAAANGGRGFPLADGLAQRL